MTTTHRLSSSLALIMHARSYLLLARNLLDHLQDPVADLPGAGLAAEVLGSQVESARLGRVQHALDGRLDELGLGGSAERVSEHHGGGEDRADWVGDALAGDVGGGAVDPARERGRAFDQYVRV